MLFALVVVGTFLFLMLGIIYAQRRVPRFRGSPTFGYTRTPLVQPDISRRPPRLFRKRRGMRPLHEMRHGRKHGAQFWAIINHPDSDLEDLKKRGTGG